MLQPRPTELIVDINILTIDSVLFEAIKSYSSLGTSRVALSGSLWLPLVWGLPTSSVTRHQCRWGEANESEPHEENIKLKE